MTVSIFIGALLGPMALGVPIAFALILSGVALMLYLGLFDAQIVAQNVLNGADSFPLMAVPFFLLAGEAGDQVIPITTQLGLLLLWISAIVTMYTGYDYFRAGIHHLIAEDA